MEEKKPVIENYYTYDLDINRYEKESVALLYRNEINAEKASFKYSPYPAPEINLEQKPIDENTGNPKEKTEYLFSQQPVAKGITAVLAYDTKYYNQTSLSKIEVISRFGKENVFKDYLNKSIKGIFKELKDSPDNYSDEEAYQIALKEHFSSEKSNLDASKVYYDESHGEPEISVKLFIRKYADSYLNWVDEKINTRINQITGLKCLPQFKTEILRNIYRKLIENKFLESSCNEMDFINAFKASPVPLPWKPIKWKGSNPALATLIIRLTGITQPNMEIVLPLFEAKNYDRRSYVESRIKNIKIITLINKALE